MIEIKVDKMSELLWLQDILRQGITNFDRPYTYRELGIDLTQDVKVDKSDDYSEDVKEQYEELHKKFEGESEAGIETSIKMDHLEKMAGRVPIFHPVGNAQLDWFNFKAFQMIYEKEEKKLAEEESKND